MYKYILSVILLFSFSTCFSQVYEGYSLDKLKAYHCLFKMNPDSSINFIYDRNENEFYSEYSGEITRLKDSLFRISATLEIGQHIMKSLYIDTLYILLDSLIARQLDKVEIEYANKKNRLLLQGYDRRGRPIPILKVPIKKDLFNSKKGSDFVKITVNRKNRITGDWVSFKIPFGSGASITKGDKIIFEVIISNDNIKTVNSNHIQTGNLQMKVLKKK